MSIPKDKLLAPSPDKHNVVLIACGSFSPITYMHLRLFPLCRDWMNANGHFVRGCYISPVHDAYKKVDLAPAEDRLEMCRRATKESPYIMVGDWESQQEGWTPTRQVIEKHSQVVNEGEDYHTDVVMICGSDLLKSFNTPGVWAPEDMKTICENGICVVQREGDLVEEFSALNPILSEALEAGKINRIVNKIENNVSSTLVRCVEARERREKCKG
eukprot:TRINITY_DN2388_c0_g1_i2.p1 TRINITY_DN2388_c0_g1~~TRINITY_DN2388_c0_g1_i2.p1  ORF type:complete len:215 (+),score=41.95 TRINITY_DN2388_c0_g1_i2:218-862(+)